MFILYQIKRFTILAQTLRKYHFGEYNTVLLASRARLEELYKLPTVEKYKRHSKIRSSNTH